MLLVFSIPGIGVDQSHHSNGQLQYKLVIIFVQVFEDCQIIYLECCHANGDPGHDLLQVEDGVLQPVEAASFVEALLVAVVPVVVVLALARVGQTVQFGSVHCPAARGANSTALKLETKS